jgi:hypothetical protein
LAESLRLLALALGFVGIFVALGLGPAVALSSRLPGGCPLLAAPTGLALAGCLMTAAAGLIGADLAGHAVLLPAALLSAGWGLWQLRRSAAARPNGEWAVPAAIAAFALLLALLPALLHGTVGPLALNVYDPWTYIPAEVWLSGHTAYAHLPHSALSSDLSLADGWALTRCGCRVGVISIGSGVSGVLGTTPDQTHLAFL